MTAPKFLKFVLVTSVVIGCLAIGSSFAGPKPPMVPSPGVWQVDIAIHGSPEQITVTMPGEKKTRTFWYLLYTITNNSGQDVDFHPSFELMTNTFRIYKADSKVVKPVYDKIQKLYENKFPLLEPINMVSGKILQGKDNARDCVAIFEDFDPNAKTAKIFITGLSNESTETKHPINNKKVLLLKTLMIEYQVPGDAINPEKRVLLSRDRSWVMR
ncbi:MAG: hypothetical protein JEZ07_10375 [Phycisphaerae bacterium]|nr:hypothetical protein [Phycisphaerae bacterium]